MSDNGSKSVFRFPDWLINLGVVIALVAAFSVLANLLINRPKPSDNLDQDPIKAKGDNSQNNVKVTYHEEFKGNAEFLGLVERIKAEWQKNGNSVTIEWARLAKELVNKYGLGYLALPDNNGNVNLDFYSDKKPALPARSEYKSPVKETVADPKSSPADWEAYLESIGGSVAEQIRRMAGGSNRSH